MLGGHFFENEYKCGQLYGDTSFESCTADILTVNTPPLGTFYMCPVGKYMKGFNIGTKRPICCNFFPTHVNGPRRIDGSPRHVEGGIYEPFQRYMCSTITAHACLAGEVMVGISPSSDLFVCEINAKCVDVCKAAPATGGADAATD